MAIAKIYADLIRKGYKTIDDVPDKLKAAVQALLDGGDN
ncbi:CD1375 family protein [Coprococcus comes]|nr:CD1375 family protein [Coprococcus comes]